MKKESITFIYRGKTDSGIEISPETFDITEYRKFLENIETLLTAGLERDKKEDVFSVKYERGSAKVTILSSAFLISSLLGDISAVQANEGLENIHPKRIEVIRDWQKDSMKKGKNRAYEITSSDKNRLKESFVISEKTNYIPKKIDYIASRKWIYGEIIDMGGVTPNIHINSDIFGKMTISAKREQIEEIESNILYKNISLLIEISQNIYDKFDYKKYPKLIEIKEYPKLDLDKFRSKSSNWKGKSVNEWISILR